MASKLIDRIGTLLRADAHGVVDALEERGLLLKQHLRDAELELLQKRARLAALIEEEARLCDEQERREAQVATLDEDVKMALEGGKDDLAKFAVRRLLPERKELEQKAREIEDLVTAREALAVRLEDQEQGFTKLVERVRDELARERKGAAPLSPWESAVPDVADEEVELELLRRRGTPVGGLA